tara:strand:+ start:328119 stop:329555 length:1437 start_codon:yes stop_codon:yes gene_type:complete
MARPNRPSLVFPNGGEEILTRVVEVTWEEPSPVSNDGTPVFYEIYYCDNYDNFDEPDWQMIAMVPSGNRTYAWEIGNYLRSEKVRVAINSVNARGERSDLSISAEDIFIKRALPPTPAVLSPVPNGRYGRSVQIVLDDSAVRNTFGQRAKYYIFFSSDKAGIPLSPVAQKIPIGTGPIVWDTSLLKPSDDYILTVYLADDDGNKSSEVNVRNIKIFNEGFFLIDTKPPSGFVQINDGEEFTRERDVSVKLFAFDETTGAHSMQFQEGEEAGPAEAIANLKYVTLSEEDGVKTLKVLFQDFGANRTSEIQKKFRILFDIDNQDIGDIIYQTASNTVWLGYNGPEPALYKSDSQGISFAARVNEPINSLSVLNGVVYIAVDTPDDTALVYRFTGVGVEQVIGLTEMETEILSMGTYKGNMYLGSMNGDLYLYDETAISLLTQFSNPIDRIYSDGSLLYILLRNNSSIHIYDGTQFVEVEL